MSSFWLSTFYGYDPPICSIHIDGSLICSTQIVSLISSNSYTITASLAANGSDSGNGGSSVVGVYKLNTGLNTTVGGTGWGPEDRVSASWRKLLLLGSQTGIRTQPNGGV